MILRDATIKYKGYDPKDLKPKSNKKICVSCDECGRIRWTPKSAYRDLCHDCKMKSEETHQKMSENHIGMKNKHHSDETKKKMSDIHRGELGNNYGKFLSEKTKKKISNSLSGKNNPMYKQKHNEKTKIKMSCSRRGIDIKDFSGFIGRSPYREHVLSESNCTKLNKKFGGSVFHHIFKSVGIYIPEYLHRNIQHNLKNNYNIKKINTLAFNYLVGDFNEF